LEVERGAEAAFGDTAVPRNYDVPHVAEGLPLRAGGKVWCVSSLDRKDVFYRPILQAHFFRAKKAKQLLHRFSWSRVIDTKTFNPH
jgi:hypothetical protein